MPDYYEINRKAYRVLECYSPKKQHCPVSIYNKLYHPFPTKDLIKHYDAQNKSYVYTELDQFYIELLLIGLKLINGLSNILMNVLFAIGKLVEPFVFSTLFEYYLCNEEKKNHRFWKHYFKNTKDKPYAFFVNQAIHSLGFALYSLLTVIPEVIEAFLICTIRSVWSLSCGIVRMISIEEERPNSLIGNSWCLG